MYFWKIEKLKSEMAARSLTDRETLPYLIAFLLLSLAPTYVGSSLETFWDWVECAATVLLTVLGALYLYLRNGGEKGSHFLQRYFAISWVVGLRCLGPIFALLFLFYFGMNFLDISEETTDEETTTAVDVLLSIIMMLFILWRSGHHIGDLAKRPQVAQEV